MKALFERADQLIEVYNHLRKEYQREHPEATVIEAANYASRQLRDEARELFEMRLREVQ